MNPFSPASAFSSLFSSSSPILPSGESRGRRAATICLATLLALLSVREAAAVTPVAPSTLPTNRPADRATVFSTTHRYAVSGCPAVQGAQIATWAEDVEERFGRLLSVTVPSGEPLAIQFYLRDDASVPRGRVLRSQRFDAGMLDQRLDMINPRLADQEDLLECLCSVLLTRAMVARLPAVARTGEPPRAPDWLAVGIAQNLYAGARQRNHRTVLASWKQGGGHALRDLLGWEFMPSGRWDDKAEAGLFVEFLLPQTLAGKRLSLMLACIEGGESITPDFLVQKILYCGTIAGAEKQRDLWLAQQQNIQTDLGGISPDRVAELVRMLEIRPSDYGIPESSKIPMLADLRDLVRRRGEKWVADVAVRMSFKMQALALGQATEFQRVAAAYVGFLDALSGTKRGVLGNRAPEAALRKLLEQAETELVNFQTAQKQRDTFLQHAAETRPTPSRDPIGSYLDQLERQSAP